MKIFLFVLILFLLGTEPIHELGCCTFENSALDNLFDTFCC